LRIVAPVQVGVKACPQPAVVRPHPLSRSPGAQLLGQVVKVSILAKPPFGGGQGETFSPELAQGSAHG